MPENALSKTYQLIIRQRPTAGGDLDGLLQTLQGEYGLETYTARQRLLGPGLALFGKGEEEKTRQIAGLLRQYGWACWLVEPGLPQFAPDRLRGLEVLAEAVVFDCPQGVVRLARGVGVVGVLADLSGGLADRHVKRLLARNAYRGRDALEVLGHDEIVHTIYRGQPIFDFYLLDDKGTPEAGVRVLPGRFNIDGLGARAELSATGNLKALIALIEEYAGRFRLHVDFGLSQLPDCPLRRSDESPSATLENLDSLTRYGWLVAQLHGDGRAARTDTPEVEAGVAASVAATAVIGQPVLGAAIGGSGGVADLPGLGEVAGEMQRAMVDEPPPGERDSIDAGQARDLPPPPERPTRSPVTWRKVLITLGGVLGGATIAVGSEGDVLFDLIARYGMAAGLVPGLAAVGFFWGGFHFIRLKRRIENTPTSKVRSIAMGMVEVHGRARRIYALVAPMTQAACAWYRLRKYRKDSNDRWKLVKEVNSNHVPFQIDDGTGRVTVDPNRAHVTARIRQTGYPGQSMLTFTAFGGHNDEDEKWVEDIVYAGTSLYVLGFARPLREEKPGLKERTLAKLRQLKLDPRAMHRYDTDGDGRLDETEWEAARHAAEQASLHEHLAENSERKRQEEHVVIGRPPQRGLPFVIAEAVSEEHLVRRYGLVSIPLLAAGAAATGFAIYKFLQFIGP